MQFPKVAAAVCALLLLASPGQARSAGGLQWVRLHLLHAAPSEVFVRLGLTHITRHGYTRGLTKGAADPSFPPGLTDVVPYDAGHALIVRGTVAGVAQFRQRVAAVDVPDPTWQVTLTLLRRDGDDYRTVTSQTRQAAEGQPLTAAFADAGSAPQYQISVRLNHDGSLAVTCRTALTLAPLADASPAAVLVPTQVWTAPVTKDTRPGDTLTFDDLAADRGLARQRLGQPAEDGPADFQLQVQCAPAPDPNAPLPPPPRRPRRCDAMREALLPRLASPDSGRPLSLTVTRRQGDAVWEGELSDTAGHRYPIEGGIPRLLPGALLDAQRSEMAARDAQVGDYDRMAFLHLFGQVEIPLTRRALGARSGDTLLEAGCGTGRMTRRLARGVRDLVAVDFSFESLRVNQKKLRNAGLAHVPLIQADLCHLPFAAGTFDRVVSCQVLEHVPGGDARARAVAALARVLRPGGTLALSAYKHSLLTRAFAKKEGEHDGGIPYFRFTKKELRALLGASFEVRDITGVLVYLYLARCRKAS